MMKRTIAVLFLMMCALVGTLAAQQTNQNCTKETETQTTSGLTGTLTFKDACGTQSNSFEMTVAGGPATNSITVNGCMRGGTCTALTSSTNTTNTILTATGGPFDNYQIAWTLTGGASPTLTFNRTATYAKATPGAYFAVPGAVVSSGNGHLYRGSDMCAAMGAATAAEVTGNLHAEGFTGTQTCAPGSMNTMLNVNFSGNIYLGCPLNLWLPLQSSAASTGNFPAAGMIVIPPQVRIHGCGISGVAGGNITTIRACPTAGAPTGCTAPATHEFAITATTVTQINAHTYLGFTIASGDVQGAEPIRISNYQNITNNSFALTVCQPSQTAAARADPNCPAYPTATTVYAAVNSGIWSTSITAAGAAYAGTLTATFAGGGCTIEPTAIVTQSGGAINTVFIQNRGRGCTTAPTATIAGSGGGAGGTLGSTIATNCASNCGTLHAEIPMFDTGAFGNNTFGQGLEGLAISCANDADCVPVRSITINEGAFFRDLFLTASQERCMDFHLFTVQNGNSLDAIRCTAGATPQNDAGTEAIYVSDTGPHGIKDFTGDFHNVTNNIADCIRINADYDQFYIKGGHCEQALYGVLLGSGNATRGIDIQDFAGPPSQFTLSTGMYQNEEPVAIKVRNEYFTNTGGLSGVITSDYQFANIHRNNCSALCGTIADDNPLGRSGSGYWISDLYTERYDVDQGNNGCETVFTTAQQLPWTNCAPWPLTSIAPLVANIGGLTACTATIEGAHEIAQNCNAACVAGNACTAGAAVHCEMYCSATPAWVETGR
jgi:hypothetical protein